MRPQVHHRHAIAQIAHDRQVVRDEQQGQPELAPQGCDQIEDLRAKRHVQSGDRLIGDDQRRPDHHRAGDGDPLPLASRELVSVAAGIICGQPDRLQHLPYLLAAGLARALPMDLQRLGDRLPYPHARVQGRTGILEDHLHAAPQLAAPGAGGSREVGAVEAHRSGRNRHEAVDPAAQRRLAASGFTDQAQGRSTVDGERCAVHGPEPPARTEQPLRGQPIGNRERLHLQQRRPAHDSAPVRGCPVRG